MRTRTLEKLESMCLFDHHEPSRHRGAFPRDKPIPRQPAAHAGRVPRLSCARRPQRRAERELTMMRWGMPLSPKFGGPPVTNIRNTASPYWRGWLKPESRCFVHYQLFWVALPSSSYTAKSACNGYS